MSENGILRRAEQFRVRRAGTSTAPMCGSMSEFETTTARIDATTLRTLLDRTARLATAPPVVVGPSRVLVICLSFATTLALGLLVIAIV